MAPNDQATVLDNVQVVIPIYKEKFDELEFFSICHSLNKLGKINVAFIHPEGLKLDFYGNSFAGANFLAFPRFFFESVRAYNQLCYEVGFYKQFRSFTHILILQPDAIILKPDELEYWLMSDFDYLGGPELNCYHYELRSIDPFGKLTSSLHPITLQGLNGGLSLRRVDKIIQALEEYPDLTKYFRSYSGGIGEDIFFSLMSRVTRKSFLIPNEIIASKFALTGNFREWIGFNSDEIPFGVHAWYRKEGDKEFILKLIADLG
jgi:uncharacterized protein DUF5672